MIRIEIVRAPDGQGGNQWRVTAPGHSTYHKHVEEVEMLVSVLLRGIVDDEQIRLVSP